MFGNHGKETKKGKPKSLFIMNEVGKKEGEGR